MPTPKLIGSAPFFMVRDLGRALDYYCDVLGFARPHLWGEPPHFAMPARDSYIVMPHEQRDGAPIYSNHQHGADWDAYFWVTDAQGLFDEVKANDATVEYEPVVRDYEIKEFAVRDGDGHILAFGQHWPAAAPNGSA